MTKTILLALSLSILFVIWSFLQFQNHRDAFLKTQGESATSIQKMKLVHATDLENQQQLCAGSEAETKNKLKEYWKQLPNGSFQFENINSRKNDHPVTTQTGTFQSTGNMLSMIDFVRGPQPDGIRIQIDSLSCEAATRPSESATASNAKDRWKSSVKFRFFVIEQDQP